MPANPPASAIPAESAPDLSPEALKRLCDRLYVEQCDAMIFGHKIMLHVCKDAIATIKALAALLPPAAP